MSSGDFGAIFVAPGRVRFRLWAPDAKQVGVLINGEPSQPMKRDQQGVYEVTLDCEPNATYKYEMNGEWAVPDPASRAQSGDVHGDSIVVDQSFHWQTSEWRGRPWHESVLYELHVGAMGGFKGVAAHLPRLKALGFTTIELMPIGDFPGRHNWGYDGVLPYAPDASYGTPHDLKSLIDQAHGLGLQVFLDVVYNHFGPDGNYISSYASGFFDKNIHTPWGNAINFKSPIVRRFFVENAIYWLECYRFDGLRFDAVHAIMDDNFLLEMAAEIRTVFKDRAIHLIVENENNEPGLLNTNPKDKKYDAQWTDDWHHCLHVILTGESEGYYEDFQNPAVQLARCLTEGFAYQGEPSKHAAGKLRGAQSGHLPQTSFVICLQNHDQIGNRAMGDRISTLAHPDALRAAMVLLLMTPQIPMIFMGEEWGETKPFLFFTDHKNELADAVREGRRKEFAHFEAFTDPAKRSKIPDPNLESTFNLSKLNVPETPNADQKDNATFIQHLLGIRSQRITLFSKDAKAVSSEALGVWGVQASWQFTNGKILTVAANFGLRDLVFKPIKGDVLVSSSPALNQIGYLPPRSTFVWMS